MKFALRSVLDELLPDTSLSHVKLPKMKRNLKHK